MQSVTAFYMYQLIMLNTILPVIIKLCFSNKEWFKQCGGS